MESIEPRGARACAADSRSRLPTRLPVIGRRNPVQSPKHKAKHTRGPLDQQELAAKHELADGYEQASGSPDIGSAVSQQGDLEANEDKWDDRVKKERRLGFGMEVVREQLRRMAVGGPQTEADRAKIYEVSSSDNSDNDGQELERQVLSISCQGSVAAHQQQNAQVAPG
eukprot:evm.model.scf_3495.2 EVM.evm.TU.scf_3495.2   scf_3495:7540-10005(-)